MPFNNQGVAFCESSTEVDACPWKPADNVQDSKFFLKNPTEFRIRYSRNRRLAHLTVTLDASGVFVTLRVDILSCRVVPEELVKGR
jgi:hypothetical protein